MFLNKFKENLTIMKLTRGRENYKKLKQSLKKKNLQKKCRIFRENFTQNNVQKKYNRAIEYLRIVFIIIKKENAHIHREIPDPFTFYNWTLVDSSDQVRLKISQSFISEQVQKRDLNPEIITDELDFYQDLKLDWHQLTEILIKLEFLFYVPGDALDTDLIVRVEDLLNRLELKSMYDEDIYFSPRIKTRKSKFEDDKPDPNFSNLYNYNLFD